MDSRGCWDCPLPISEIAFWLGIAFALVVFGAALQRMRRRFVSGVGFLTTSLGYILAASFTFVIPRWGIQRSHPFDAYPHAVSWLVLLGFDALLVVTTLAILRWRKTDAVLPKS